MISFLQSAIRFSAVFIYGCVGEIVTEKSGHLNLGIPGIMCGGTAGGCLGVSVYMSTLSNPNAPNYIRHRFRGAIRGYSRRNLRVFNRIVKVQSEHFRSCSHNVRRGIYAVYNG